MVYLLSDVVRLLLVVQATQATVAGTVRDVETGEPVAGAIVALPGLGGSASTTADGRYQLLDVAPGPHTITVRRIGYAPRRLEALVPAGGLLEINISLSPIPFRLPPIEVSTPVAVRGLEPGGGPVFPDRAVSMAAVRSDPLLAEPDALQALGGGDVVLNPETPGGLHVRGGASDQTAYLLDGIPVFSPYHAAGMFSAWNPDALAGLTLSSAAPSPAGPHALSGTVAAETRAPGTRQQAQGSLSTTQTRLTLDGPLGVAGARYLVSLRWGFPGVVVPKHEASYLGNESGDRLAKLELPAAGGRLRLLGYDNENKIDAAAAPGAVDSGQGVPRNVFEWRSRSLGAGWSRDFADLTLRAQGWTATSEATSAWTSSASQVALTADRRDAGLQAEVEHHATHATTTAGLRIERSRTAERVGFDSVSGPATQLAARTTVATAFAHQTRKLGSGLGLTLGASLAAGAGDLYLGPRAQLRWQPSGRVTLAASYARQHQFSQSVRNAESVVGNVFPADLYLGAGAGGTVPVARSDQAVISAEYRPSAAVRLGMQGYLRRLDGLLLVAPHEGGPFATAGLGVGSGVARGASLDAAVSTGHLGLVLRYGWQQVRLEEAGSSYVPEHGATHLLEGGVILFPAPGLSVRLGATGAFGRRATTVSGGLDWEACNLRDRGCEFGGSPQTDGEPLGGTALPAYLRLDLGIRKEWRFTVAGRDASLALFGTVTNLLDRKNVLTYSRDPATGARKPIEMRPLAPLLVGLDWRF